MESLKFDQNTWQIILTLIPLSGSHCTVKLGYNKLKGTNIIILVITGICNSCEHLGKKIAIWDQKFFIFRYEFVINEFTVVTK